MGVADALFVFRARSAVVFVGGNDGDLAVLEAFSTSLSAGRPGIPFVFTVDGARGSVAVPFVNLGWALLAAMLGVNESLAGAFLDTSVATDGAFLPGAPGANDTVDWAAVELAMFGVDFSAATFAAVSNIGDDRFGSGVKSGAATGVSARVVEGPLGEEAIDGASLQVADALFRVRTGIAVVGSLVGDSVRATLNTTTAGLGATRPCIPFVCAVKSQENHGRKSREN